MKVRKSTLFLMVIVLVGGLIYFSLSTRKRGSDELVSQNVEVKTDEESIKENNTSNSDEKLDLSKLGTDLEDDFIDYADADFTKEGKISYVESDDGKSLKDFQIEFKKDQFTFKRLVKNYEYKFNDKTYKGDLEILYTGGAENSNGKNVYYALYQGTLSEK